VLEACWSEVCTAKPSRYHHQDIFCIQNLKVYNLFYVDEIKLNFYLEQVQKTTACMCFPVIVTVAIKVSVPTTDPIGVHVVGGICHLLYFV
jgi:hypothetical protein